MSFPCSQKVPSSRVSAKLRRAIGLRVRKGLCIKQTCTEAGLSTAGWHKAMKRPAVRELLEAEQQVFLSDSNRMRAFAKVRAIEVALELLDTAKSEAVRMRAAEFLSGEGKAAAVSVRVDARPQSQGYAYIPPGTRVVDLEPLATTPKTLQQPETALKADIDAQE